VVLEVAQQAQPHRVAQRLSAPAPQRQSADQESMVFNINFGGAVIYDTRRAAEEALADRVATVFNRPRRGAVRPVMMRG
jgi:hypothetical protein